MNSSFGFDSEPKNKKKEVGNIVQRFALLTVIIVLIFSNKGIIPAFAEITPPVIHSLATDKQEAGPGDTITAIVDAADSVSDIYSINVIYRGPDGISQLNSPAYLNKETGKYEAKLSITAKLRPGEWKLEQINIMDKAYNSYYIKRDKLISPENGDFTIVNADFDVTPPSVDSVMVDKNKAGEGDTVTISAKASDTQTGISSIVVYYRNGNYLIGGRADYNPGTGNYETGIQIKDPSSMPLGIWTFYSASASDKNGNKMDYYSVPNSNSFNIIDKNDITPPAAPVVNGVSDVENIVTGRTDPNTSVTVTIDNLVLHTVSDVNGCFSVNIPIQAEGSVILVSATDDSDNTSPAAKIVVTDGRAPEAPQVDEISNASKRITGTAEKNSLIEVMHGSQLLGSTTAGDDGSFIIENIYGTLFAGDTLNITATDKAGNRSEAAIIEVKDGMPPAYLAIDEVSDQSVEVTGKTESGALVTVIIGNATYSATADSQGNYKVSIPLQKANTVFKVLSSDKYGNASEPVDCVVIDRTAPDMPLVKEVSNLSVNVEGTSEPGAYIIVTIGSDNHYGYADASGSFKVNIPVQNAGTAIKVIAKDRAGLESPANIITVIDKIAPQSPLVNVVSNLSKEVTGKAEPGSNVVITIGKTNYRTVAASSGTFKVVIPQQTAGTYITAAAIDQAGNVSKETTVKVLDKIAPDIPTVNPVSNLSKTITGKAEAKSEVTAAIGTKKYTSYADANGMFKITIPAQSAGVKIYVTSKDASENISSARCVTVLDKIAPAAPKVNKIYYNSTSVTGAAEAYSIITVKNGNTTIGTGKTDKYGKFKVSIKPQKRNTILSITATDGSNNKSAAVSVKVN